MFDKINLSTTNLPVTRREVTSVLGNVRKPLPSIAKAQALLNERAAAEQGDTSATAKVTVLNPKAQAGDTAFRPDALAETAVGSARLVVGANVRLKCTEIVECDTLLIEGHVEANMNSRILNIADEGSLSGKVSVDIAEIHGCFEGELNARSQLIIHPTGRVSGKVRYGQLFVGQGGELRGDADTAELSPPSDRSPEDSPSRQSLKAVPADSVRSA